jgi:hypothetical protein
MHRQRSVVLACSAAVIVATTVLPWMRSTLALKLRMGEWHYLAIGLAVVAAILAIVGDREGRISTARVGWTTLCGVAIAAAGAYLIWSIGDASSEDPMASFIASHVHVGFGLYVLVATGAALALLPWLFHWKKRAA